MHVTTLAQMIQSMQLMKKHDVTAALIRHDCCVDFDVLVEPRLTNIDSGTRVVCQLMQHIALLRVISDNCREWDVAFL